MKFWSDKMEEGQCVCATEIRLYPSCFILIKTNCDYCEFVEGKDRQELVIVVWDSGRKAPEDEKNKRWKNPENFPVKSVCGGEPRG